MEGTVGRIVKELGSIYWPWQGGARGRDLAETAEDSYSMGGRFVYAGR